MIINRSTSTLPDLHHKVAIVTGAGRGIGRETARILAHLGATTIIAEVSQTGLETEAQIRHDGGTAHFIPTDVADEASVNHLRDQVLGTWGRADILINNATIFTVGPLLHIKTADWDRVMAVNLRGAFLCIKAFLPAMLEQKSGVVVTMESADGMPYIAPYLATKVGLRSLAQSLAQEVGDQSGVSVFCYGPGLVETPGLSEALERLAPLYGLTRQEFIGQMEAQLVTTEVTATGLVGAVLHAPEFHGQEIGFAMGLAKLGISASGEPLATAARQPAVSPASRPEQPAPGANAPLVLNRQLESILRDNIREYDELNLFQRPIVKRMFQSGTGLKVEDWLASAQHMSRQLEQGARIPHEDLVRYTAQLNRLAQFILKQESDARGFFKNPDTLNRALQALRQRRQAVLDLVVALESASARICMLAPSEGLRD
ncbi:MAG: short-chain dehydrogenase [Symbiobacteriaceae bacterium]|jgi:NAD(P)-dependent dehydrogenase (short-subunit alcohol dehydrogenase family)|nr:short-chain dehydrogenase [Symbiobacteriaceae bacterium]